MTKRPLYSQSGLPLVFALLALVFCTLQRAQAVTKTWDGGGATGDWNSALNWDGDTLPAVGDDILFNNAGQSPLENICLNAPSQTINSLTLNLTVGTNQNWNLGATSGTGIGTGITTLATTGTGFTFSNARSIGGLLQINAIVSGSKTVTKTGVGTVILSGANTFTGATTINGGTLMVATSSGSALGTTSAITVNSGGTLLLGASDQIKNTAPITLAGGTFAKGNFSEGTTSSAGAGALTLSASGSHLDFGTGTVGTLTFASFTPGAFTLTIDNWSNGTTDRLIFASDQSANLSSFNFTGYGAGAIEFDLGGGYYEITPTSPVPEPSTYVAATLALGVLACHLRRRSRRQKVAPALKRGPAA